jgi:ribose transport system ATP-binding protein
VGENVVMKTLRKVSGGGLVRERRIAEVSNEQIDSQSIKTPSWRTTVSSLSGGNQQKVVLARWLCSGARMLVLDDPTRGIDVGAKEEVFRLVRRLAAEGVAVLYLTSEIREARALSDRLLVMAGGRIVAELAPSAPEDEIMTAAGGVHA